MLASVVELGQQPEASLPKVATFDFRSLSFASAASSFDTLSGLPLDSLTLAWRLETYFF